ncbi:uncharacterized protein LOC126990996 [Eriocheir sinensis]|uniref:uncharacterized protein LOC126990996 n=1 Tax=Eriocheir sinensis TaxID=95602 RepID=UPI0021C897C7|nr:uncharacterized protein LOC126990996 [Eriocheir sinensis]XP_050705630.1 uncharacterized protein LOC126990996 [Eriocheir sinensis]
MTVLPNLSQISTLDLTSFREVSLLEVCLRKGDKLLLGCFYRSPNSSDDNNEELCDLLRNICGNSYSHICLMGDFNTPHINWDLHTTSQPEHSHESMFLQTVQDCFLYQHVDQPTRARGTNTPSILDLILTNEQNMVSDIEYHAPLGASDHKLLVFKYHCYCDRTNNKVKLYYKYNNGDYDGMRASLAGSEWLLIFEEIVNNLNMEDTWTNLKQKILELRDEFVPTATIGNNNKWRYEFPISQELRDLIKKKNTAYRSWNAHRYREDAEQFRLQYVRLRNQCQQSCRKAKRDHEKGIAEQSKNQPKLFWKYSKHKLKTRSGVAPLLGDPNNPNSLCHTDTGNSRFTRVWFTRF